MCLRAWSFRDRLGGTPDVALAARETHPRSRWSWGSSFSCTAGSCAVEWEREQPFLFLVDVIISHQGQEFREIGTGHHALIDLGGFGDTSALQLPLLLSHHIADHLPRDGSAVAKFCSRGAPIARPGRDRFRRWRRLPSGYRSERIRSLAATTPDTASPRQCSSAGPSL